MQRRLNICFLESPGFVPPSFFRTPNDLFIVLEATSVSKNRTVNWLQAQHRSVFKQLLNISYS